MNKRKDIVPNNLKEYRLKAGLTQQQVAKTVGVNSAERICHWEKGRNTPNMEHLRKLCSLFKASVENLYKKLD